MSTSQGRSVSRGLLDQPSQSASKAPTSTKVEMDLVPSPPALNNSNILELSTHMLLNCTTPELILPENDIFLCPTSQLGNSCVSPLVALRGWGLLATMGYGKTKKKILGNVARVLGCKKDQVHHVLSTLDKRLLLGSVMFFADCPKSALLDEEMLTDVRSHYMTLNSHVSPFHKMCFDCDMDGMRSIFVINRAIREATKERVQYVVREENAPNRCALAVLVSAIDCTFYWRHEGHAERKTTTFGGEKEPKTTVMGWLVAGSFYHKKDEKGMALRLDSHQNDLNLILFLPYGHGTPTAAEVLEVGKNLPAPREPSRVFVPQFSVATPLCLRDCSKSGPLNMQRVFDREKSDLSGYLRKFHDFCPIITPLWDHYHKAVFKIVEGQENGASETRQPRLQTRYVKETKEAMAGVDVVGQASRYHEDHLPLPLVGQPTGKREEVTADVLFDQPFYFLVVQDLLGEPLVHCFGRFANTDAINKATGSHCPF